MRPTVVLVMGLAWAAAVQAPAQSVVSEREREALRGVPDRWGVTLGSFWQTFDATVRLDGSAGHTGTEIHLESDLDLDRIQTNFQLGGFYRFSDRSRLDVSYLSWSRSGSKSLQRSIVWDDHVFDVGTTVSASHKAQLLNAIYKYSFYNNGHVTFGLNGGVSSLWDDASLSAQGLSAGAATATPTEGGSQSSNHIFPIPVLGAHFEMTLTRRLFWRAEGNFFVARISEYDGNLNEFATSLDYYFTRNVGLGAGYAANVYRVTKSGSRGGDFLVDYSFSGVFAYLGLAF